MLWKIGVMNYIDNTMGWIACHACQPEPIASILPGVMAGLGVPWKSNLGANAGETNT